MLVPNVALAGPCKDLVPSPIYGSGGSATKPLLGKVAAKLAGAAEPLTVVYQSPGACVGVSGLFGGTKITGTASYWDASGAEQSCTLPETGEEIEFANSGNSATSCPGVSSIPQGFGDFLGPVNSFTLIVPKASSQTSISAEAAYFVFGFGQLGQVSPWIDESQIFRRDANSAAQLFVALNAGLAAERFKGIDTKTNAGTVTAVSQSPKPEAAIGLVSGELADANRSNVRVLAFQAKGQRCGYWPDSTDTSYDKKHLRDGHYTMWAPLHFFSKIGADGKPTRSDLARFIGLFTGEVDGTSLSLLESEIKAGTVPRCAMRVWRETDTGAVRKNQVDKTCHCYFDSVATGATSCAACTGNEQCSGGAVCNYGFCEAR